MIRHRESSTTTYVSAFAIHAQHNIGQITNSFKLLQVRYYSDIDRSRVPTALGLVCWEWLIIQVSARR